MRILLLGGTGPMGTYLTDCLRERASEIVVTSRRQRESSGAVLYQQGNAKNSYFLEGLLAQRWDAIIDFMVYSTAEFKSRVDRFLAATDQYFFLSSARVYAASEHPLTEASPRLLDVCTDADYLATDEYALAKARQENCLYKHSKRNWTIIRPYITYGPERLQLGVLEKEAWLYRALQGRTIIFSEDIAQRRTTMTHGADVARAMAALVGEPRAVGEDFHITGVDTLLWGEVLDIYLDCLSQHGQEARVKKVNLDQFIHCHGSRHQVTYDRLFNRVFDNTKINQFVETRSFGTIRSGLTKCMEHFFSEPRFSAISWGLEGKKDRLSGEFASLLEMNSVRNLPKYFYRRF